METVGWGKKEKKKQNYLFYERRNLFKLNRETNVEADVDMCLLK